MIRRTFVLLVCSIALAACTASQGRFAGGSPGSPQRGAGYPGGGRSAGSGVALLAPMSGPNAERGQALVRAAQLALAAPGSPKLDVRDTQGTAAGAAAAAAAAIAGGAGIILGPLTTAETAAVAGPARAAGVPVLAFTSDPAQAQPGVWTLGIMPDQQVQRLVAASVNQGRSRFAALLPENEFGRAMGTALTRAASSAGVAAPDIRYHGAGMAAINTAVRDISGYSARRGPVDAQIRAARASRDAEGRRRAAELSRTAIPPPPMDTLLLAATGESLTAIASLLPYYDLDAPAVRVLGPALWASPAARADAALANAWFAAPDPAARAAFDAQYLALHGAPAPGYADFAFDAAAIARVLAAEGGFSVAGLVRPEGFAGVDGVLALRPDGTVRRGLALFEIRRGRVDMIEPAPESMSAPGI